MTEKILDWIVPDWPSPPGIHALITTRSGGVSGGNFASLNLGDSVGDDAQSVLENCQRLRGHLPSAPRWLTQVHGSTVVDAEKVVGRVHADASVTSSTDVVCAVRMADCLPVLLCDRKGTRVGVAHAGWRGLCEGVIENAVARMDAQPQQLMAFLGPAIGPDAFEVGKDVYSAFVNRDASADSAFRPHVPGKWMANLFMLARQRLQGVGVDAIYGGTLCTYSMPTLFFSHRRDKVSGRMAALIWRS